MPGLLFWFSGIGILCAEAPVKKTPGVMDIDFLAAIISLAALLFGAYQWGKRNSAARQKKEVELQVEAEVKETQQAKQKKSHYDCYTDALKEELGYISMLGLPGLEGVKVNLNNNTFVPLRLTGRHEQDDQSKQKPIHQGGDEGEKTLYPDEILKRAFHDRRGRRMLLVIGDPGAGKTTLLKYYALCARDDQARLGFTRPVAVFYLPLRELVRNEHGKYKSLQANLVLWSERHHQNIQDHSFDEWLRGETVLVLFDGLDEISNTDERKEVCQWIDNAWKGFRKAYFIVTSRGTGYRQDEGIELEAEYERADVQDFTPKQQEQFLISWFTAAFLKETPEEGGDVEEWERRQRAEAGARTTTMVAHLNGEKNKGLRQLAAIPMILQIMAILWKERDYMPKNRVMLYDAVINYLLEIRDERIGIKPPMSAAHARMVLQPVSLWMQENNKDQLLKSEMHAAMQEWLDTVDAPPTAEVFCDFLVKRAGLLVETGGKEYRFRHKSFREYLTGVQLKEDRPYEHLHKLVNNFGEDWWEEPLRFFIGSVDANVFDAFMKKLFDSPVSEELTTKNQLLLQTIIEEAKVKKIDALCTKLLDATTTASRQRVVLDCLKAIGKAAALNALEQFKVNNLAKNKDIADRADDVIIDLQTPAPEEIARVSQQIVNLEQRPSSFRNSIERQNEYILIRGGSYCYSVTGKEEYVPDLYVAKYPVTNKLYRSFIASLPKFNARFIEELNKIAKNNTWDGGFSDYLKGERDLAALFRSNYDEDRKFDGDDQPVVGVTWYAARAYCLWLSMQEKSERQYRLPNEVEWEWAAGGKQGTTGQRVREYPWLEEKGGASSTLLNYNNNVGATTPVGSYPDGATPEGLYDMAGNVWEWTDSWWDETRSDRVVRGGGWSSRAVSCRSAFRSSVTPDDRSSNVGFRLVFVP
ncbi:MAG: NACHT domain-containing protein [Chlorobium sp.]